MARYNTVRSTTSTTGATSISAPTQGLVTTFTGTAPYTVTLPNPVLYLGQTQTFYNATAGTITVSTPSGNIVGPRGSAAATTFAVVTGAVIALSSDGTNYILSETIGGPVTGTTASFSGVVNITNSTVSGGVDAGALQVDGGVGINGALYTGGVATVAGLSSTSTTTLSPASANVSISPTGTGTVTISPATAGTINNMSIGATTATTGRFTNATITDSTAGSSSGGAINSTGGARFGAKVYVGGDIENTGIITSSSTSHFKIPAGTSAQRPSAALGQFRYNSDISAFEGHNGTFWKDFTKGFTHVDVGSNIAATVWDCYWVDTSAAARTITLPNSGLVKGDTIRFIDLRKTFDTNALTIARNGNLIMGDAADMTVSTEAASFDLVYHSGTYGWFIFSI